MTLTKLVSFPIILIAILLQGCANKPNPNTFDANIDNLLDFKGEVVRVSFRFENKKALEPNNFSDEERRSIKDWINNEVFSGEGKKKYIVNLDFINGKSDCKTSNSGTGIGGAMAKMAASYTEGIVKVSLKQIRPIKQEINTWQAPYMDIKSGVPGTHCRYEEDASKYRAKESLIKMLKAQFLLQKGEIEISEIEKIHKEMITPKGASTGDKVFLVLGHTFGRVFTAGEHIIDGLASFENVDLSPHNPYNVFDPRNTELYKWHHEQMSRVDATLLQKSKKKKTKSNRNKTKRPVLETNAQKKAYYFVWSKCYCGPSKNRKKQRLFVSDIVYTNQYDYKNLEGAFFDQVRIQYKWGEPGGHQSSGYESKQDAVNALRKMKSRYNTRDHAVHSVDILDENIWNHSVSSNDSLELDPLKKAYYYVWSSCFCGPSKQEKRLRLFISDIVYTTKNDYKNLGGAFFDQVRIQYNWGEPGGNQSSGYRHKRGAINSLRRQKSEFSDDHTIHNVYISD